VFDFSYAEAMRPIIGVANVAKWIAGTIKRPYEGVEIADMTAELVDINGGPGIVMSGAGRVIATSPSTWTPPAASSPSTTWPTRTNCTRWPTG
jgi:hypothetical protein